MKLDESIALIKKRWPEVTSSSQEEPVFIFAAGWRSGSTMLQRMLLKHCLVWGEPFGSSGLLERLSQPLGRFDPKWPLDSFFVSSEHWGDRLGEEWIANLYPTMRSLLDAHLAFHRTLFIEPSRERGFARWGLKEVRYSIEHAHYLRWLFPRARFLFLLRNPYACWSSYRRAHSRVLRFFPEPLITTPEQFGNHWVQLAGGFYDRFQEVEGLLLRYETLVQPELDVRPLERYLGFGVDMAVRANKVGASPGGLVSNEELAQLDKIVGPLAARMGYAFTSGKTDQF